MNTCDTIWLEDEDVKWVRLFALATKGNVMLILGGFPGGLVEIHGTESSLEVLANKILVLLRDQREMSSEQA